jgi:hypothetical protein
MMQLYAFWQQLTAKLTGFLRFWDESTNKWATIIKINGFSHELRFTKCSPHERNDTYNDEEPAPKQHECSDANTIRQTGHRCSGGDGDTAGNRNDPKNTADHLPW